MEAAAATASSGAAAECRRVDRDARVSLEDPEQGGAADAKLAPPPRFEDVAGLSKEAKAAMREGFGFERQTPVQAQTFGRIMCGADLVVRAKTGAGKTLSFLLPAFERLARGRTESGGGNIAVLVLSPVRELSQQIFQEADKLARYYEGVHVLCMIGGTSWEEDVVALDSAAAGGGGDEDRPIVLIATPGRLQTHVNKTEGFAARLTRVKVLVLDEVDQIAKSPVFRAATSEILDTLPPASQRQTLFYSATMSDEVSELMSEARAGVAGAQVASCAYVDMVTDYADVSIPEEIQQTYSVLRTEDMTLGLWKGIQRARDGAAVDGEKPKVVVIFMTGRIAAYYAEAFRKASEAGSVYEIHARLPQSRRTEESERFRAAEEGVLFTSDVSSRGLDYPGVTDVIQMGAARTKEEYIHRLGRTGRGEGERKKGRGLLLLHEFERTFVAEQLADLSLTELPLLDEHESHGEAAKEAVADAARMPDFLGMQIGWNVKAQAYYSRINHVMRQKTDAGVDLTEESVLLEVMREAKLFAASIGALDSAGRPPEITVENAIKMGVDKLEDPAVHIVKERTAPPSGGGKKAKNTPAASGAAPGADWAWVPQRLPREIWEEPPTSLANLDPAAKEALSRGIPDAVRILLQAAVPPEVSAVALAAEGDAWKWYRVRGKTNEQQVKKKGKECTGDAGTWVRTS